MNNNELKKELMNEISAQLLSLDSLEAGGEEQKQVVENVNKLTRLVIDIDSVQEGKLEKEREAKERKKERCIKIGLGAAGVGVTAWQIIDHHVKWKELLKFEETGTISSSGGRQMLSGLFKIVK